MSRSAGAVGARERREFLRRFGRILPANRQARILEVACGSGAFLANLQDLGFSNCVGIDLSGEQIAQAAARRVNGLLLGDALAVLRPDTQQFDVIAAHDFVEHLAKDEVINFMTTAYGWLCPGGQLWLSTANSQTLVDMHRYADFTHETGFTPSSLRQVLLASGFRDVQLFPKGPIAIDGKSAARWVVWQVVDRLVRLYLAIAEGAGNSESQRRDILTSVMFVVATR